MESTKLRWLLARMIPRFGGMRSSPGTRGRQIALSTGGSTAWTTS